MDATNINNSEADIHTINSVNVNMRERARLVAESNTIEKRMEQLLRAAPKYKNTTIPEINRLNKKLMEIYLRLSGSENRM